MHRSAGLRARSAIAVAAVAALVFLAVPLLRPRPRQRGPTPPGRLRWPWRPPALTARSSPWTTRPRPRALDMATDPSTGTAYLGWISSSYATQTLRAVHLCVLPPGASSCAGAPITSAVDGPSAAGLQIKVTAPGVATLVWFHQLNLTEARLATAMYADGVLSGPSTCGSLRATAGCWTSPTPATASSGRSPRTTPAPARSSTSRPRAPRDVLGLVIAPWYAGHASLGFVFSKAAR